MGTRAVEFLGRLYRIPGARGAFRAKPQQNGLSEDFTTLIIIGSSENGWDFSDDTLPVEKRVMEFGNEDEALAVLHKGDLADAIAGAFKPSKDERFPGPQLIKAINVSPNTHASASIDTLKAANQATVKSVVPGLKGNSTRFRITASGTIIEIGDASATPEKSQTIEANELSIQYSGDATTAIIDIGSTGLNVVLTGQTDNSASLALLFSEYPTIGELADYINSQQGYTALVLSNPDRKTEWLDHIEATETISVKTAALTLKALFTEQQRFINGSGLVEVTPATVRKPLSDQASFVYLSGGASGSAVAADYIDAISYVYSEETNGFFLSVCSGDQSVALHLADKLGYGNTPDGSNEKYGSCGIDTETLTNPLDRVDPIKLINSQYLSVGAVPIENRQADKITSKVFPGWYLGVLHNAIKASANLRETPTYKDLNILDAPEKLSKTIKKKLIAAGGLIVDRKPNSGPFKITFALTTYQKENLILNQSSTVCTALGLVKDFREWMENEYLGEVPLDPDAFGGGITDASIRTAVNNRFKFVYIARYGWLSRNIYTGQSAFDENYTIERDGDALYFVFPNGNVVSPINFMFSLLNLDVIKGSSTGA